MTQVMRMQPVISVKKTIKRGTKEAGQKCFSTTPLHNHIKINHPKEYRKERNKSEQKRTAQFTPAVFSTGTTESEEIASETSKQTSIDEYLKSKKVWNINDSRSQAIHRKIGLMMALDNQPFTLVEDTGFNNLINHLEPRYSLPSRIYFSQTITPQLYMELKNKTSIKLKKANHISFSSDIWTCPISHESFISLSGHCIDKDFNRIDVVLHASHFSESHTGVNISEKLESMWDSWKIQVERRHLLVRDGASNMVKGSNLAEIPSIHCTIH